MTSRSDAHGSDMVRGTDPRTSHDAALRVRGHLSDTQQLVLAAIAGAGTAGLTDAELAALPVFGHLRESTARKRRVELHRAGFVIPAGNRDRQTVWVATSRRLDTLHTVATGDIITRSHG